MKDRTKSMEETWLYYEAISYGVLIHDSAGNYVYANPVARDLFEINRQDLSKISERFSKLYLFREDGSCFPWREMPSGQSLKSGKSFSASLGFSKTPRPDIGEIRWVLVSSQPVFDQEDTGKILEVITTFVDFSVRKQTADRLKSTHRSLKIHNSFRYAIGHAATEADLLKDVCRALVENGYHTLAVISRAVWVGECSITVAGWNGLAVETYCFTLRVPAGEEAEPDPLALLQLSEIPDWIKNCMTESQLRAISCPVATEEMTYGRLSVFPRGVGLEETDRNILAQMADELAQRIAALCLRAERHKARESLRFTQYSVDETADSIFWYNCEGKFFYANRGACKSLGYEPAEMLKLSVPDINPDLEVEKWEDIWRQIKEESPLKFEARHRRKDGSIFPVDISVNLLQYQGMEYCCSIARNISKRKHAEEVLRENEGKYRNLVERTGDWVWELDKNLVFVYSNPQVAKILGYTSKELVGTSFMALMPSTEAKRIRGEMGKILGEGRAFSLVETLLQHKDGHHVVVDTNGTLITNQHGVFSGYQGITRDITERKRAENELTLSLEKLNRSMNGAIEAMAMTVEMKDPYTAGHQRQVAELAYGIAQRMGLSAHRAEGVRLAAIVHDIGKIAIPAEILSKPGQITDLEFSLIKTHPQVGYDILKGIDFPWPIAQIVYQHHERLNGSGYPCQLTDDVLLEAKIIGVADVVEAMSSHRPYRPALGIDMALNEITLNRGELYDNDVVETCLTLFREGYTIA